MRKIIFNDQPTSVYNFQYPNILGKPNIKIHQENCSNNFFFKFVALLIYMPYSERINHSEGNFLHGPDRYIADY